MEKVAAVAVRPLADEKLLHRPSTPAESGAHGLRDVGVLLRHAQSAVTSVVLNSDELEDLYDMTITQKGWGFFPSLS